MATWQFDLHLIPRSKLVELFGTVPTHLDQKSFDELLWWENQGCSIDDMELSLGSFLRPRRSRTADIKCWGDEDGDCVSVIVDDHRIAEIAVRINVQTLDPEFIENVCTLSTLYKCVLRTERSKLIEPDRDLLLQEIAHSAAAAFVLDPIQYLKRLK